MRWCEANKSVIHVTAHYLSTLLNIWWSGLGKSVIHVAVHYFWLYLMLWIYHGADCVAVHYFWLYLMLWIYHGADHVAVHYFWLYLMLWIYHGADHVAVHYFQVEYLMTWIWQKCNACSSTLLTAWFDEVDLTVDVHYDFEDKIKDLPLQIIEIFRSDSSLIFVVVVVPRLPCTPCTPPSLLHVLHNNRPLWTIITFVYSLELYWYKD